MIMTITLLLFFSCFYEIGINNDYKSHSYHSPLREKVSLFIYLLFSFIKHCFLLSWND